MQSTLIGLVKLAALAGGALALAACETTPGGTGGASGGGAAEPPASAGAADPAPGGEAATTVEPLQPPEDGQAAEAARGPDDMLVDVGDRVFFDFDRYNVRPDGQDTLRRQAEMLRLFPALTITIAGHCDERGTRDYNLALGERRAMAARDVLVRAGIDAARIKTISYGKERPIVLGHTKTAWAQNRVAITTLN